MQINLTPDWTLPVIMVIFMANYLVVRRFFLRPINEILVTRESEISDAERRYEESLAGFQEATREMESQVNEARRNGTKVREQLRAEAAELRTALVTKTRGEADGIVATADASLKRDVDTARTKIVTDSESLARLAAEQIAGRKLS